MFFAVLREFSAFCFECVKITVVFFTHNRRNKMLQSIKFLRKKSRGEVEGDTKPTPLAPVILGLVPRIFWQQGTNLVNKLALLNKCLLREDSWDKPKNDWCRGRGVSAYSQSGRSMIEMLGVLAIIAVLSVGGIAGYSKAMEMYKINKTLEHYNYLVLGMLDYVSETKNLAEKTNTGMTMIAEAAGLIPATWQKENNFNLRDDMENIVQIFANKTSLSIDYIFQNSEKHSITDKLCNNLFNNTLKPLSDSIQVIYVTIAGKIDFAIYYGNTTCDVAESKKCLRDVELNDIRDSCNFCAEQKFCSIAVKF